MYGYRGAVDKKGTRLQSKQLRWALLALLTLGVGVRVAAVRGDLWLDEIWSIEMAQKAGGPLGVFTALHHDNNHHLNTLALLALGDLRPSWVYRVMPLVASVLWLVWIVLAVGKRSRLEAVLVLALLSSSYFFILQGTEARGYAPLLLFLSLAWTCLELKMQGRPGPWRLLFGIFSVLGLLSHFSFVFFLSGAVVWVVYAGVTPDHRPAVPRMSTIGLFGLPTAAGLLLYWVDGRHVRVGGAPLMSVAEGVGQAAALALGLPAQSYFLVVAPLILTVVAWVELARRRDEGDSEWILFALSIFIAPALALVVIRPPFVAARYFLIPVFLALFLLAGRLRRAWQQGGSVRKATVAAVLIVIVAGNLVQLSRFLTGLRGHYGEAVERIAVEAAGRPTSVGSDHDHRNATVLQFYARRDQPDLEMEYVEVGDWERVQPEWLLLHSFDEGLYGNPLLTTPAGSYRLVETFRHYGLSGWDWFLYRRD